MSNPCPAQTSHQTWLSGDDGDDDDDDDDDDDGVTVGEVADCCRLVAASCASRFSCSDRMVAHILAV
jgi:hypothetical protein